MTYCQLTSVERYMLAALKKQGHSQAEIARNLGRHRSTICRELKLNSSRYDGGHRPSRAVEMTSGRRSRSRRNRRFTAREFSLVERLLRELWSPEQTSGQLRLAGGLAISHETIYRYFWNDRHLGGSLHTHLRCAQKKRRKRYRSYDSRGRLAAKRHISERPNHIDQRSEFGHWEIDTMIGKLKARTTQQLNLRTLKLINNYPEWFKSITDDNGTEFHAYKEIEQQTGIPLYFATPHRSWERGTNENANGLIRQYIPKGTSMTKLTQHNCNRIARKLNDRPRKRHGFRTPKERTYEI